MTQINYCKNLWEKLIPCQEMIPPIEVLTTEAGKTGDYSGVDQRIDALDLALKTFHEQWLASFVELRDGRKLFGPEYEFIDEMTYAENSSPHRQNAFTMGLPPVRWNIEDFLNQGKIGINHEGFLEKLDLNIFTYTTFNLNRIANFVYLKELYCGKLYSKDLNYLNHLKRLEKLSINSEYEQPVDFEKNICALSKLEQLSLNFFEMPDFDFLLKLPKLKSLQLDFREFKYPEDVELETAKLLRITTLEKLRLPYRISEELAAKFAAQKVSLQLELSNNHQYRDSNKVRYVYTKSGCQRIEGK